MFSYCTRIDNEIFQAHFYSIWHVEGLTSWILWIWLSPKIFGQRWKKTWKCQKMLFGGVFSTWDQFSMRFRPFATFFKIWPSWPWWPLNGFKVKLKWSKITAAIRQSYCWRIGALRWKISRDNAIFHLFEQFCQMDPCARIFCALRSNSRSRCSFLARVTLKWIEIVNFVWIYFQKRITASIFTWKSNFGKILSWKQGGVVVFGGLPLCSCWAQKSLVLAKLSWNMI